MKRAFTLIELLVVIAIIAILAAILFPVFAQAKESAKKANDLSNAKQMAVGFIMYSADVDDVLPIAYPDNNLASYTTPWNRTTSSDLGYARRQAFWTNSTYPYIKNYKLHEIVGAPTTNWFSISEDSVNPMHYRDGYTYNSYLNVWPASGVDKPADVVLLWPGNGKQNLTGFGNNYPLPYFKTSGFPSNSAMGSTPYKFTNTGSDCLYTLGIWTGGDAWDYRIFAGGFNMSYVDGHAKYVKAGSSKSPWSKVDSSGYILEWNYDDVDGPTNDCWYVAPMAPIRSGSN